MCDICIVLCECDERWDQNVTFSKTRCTMPKIFEVFYVCPFFWFSFSVGSPHKASNGGALLRQANTKCDITRGVVLRSASITDKQINDWKKLMSFPHQIVFSLAAVLQWIYVRIMKNLFNQRIALFGQLFCRFLFCISLVRSSSATVTLSNEICACYFDIWQIPVHRVWP